MTIKITNGRLHIHIIDNMVKQYKSAQFALRMAERDNDKWTWEESAKRWKELSEIKLYAG
jgi:hypothetical protein